MAIGTVPQPPPADQTVAGHRRDGGARLWSVRTQLLAPILVAMLGLAVLGTVQTSDAVASARDARRGQVLASTATATVRLAHELERELAEMVALRQRGGRAGVQLVLAQRARTDEAVGRYRNAAAAAAHTVPTLDEQVRAADLQLDKLSMARSLSDYGSAAGDLPDPVYHDIAGALLAVADALPSQLRDPGLTSTAREVAALAAVEHSHALERDLLRTVFSRGSLAGTDLIDLARIDTARQQREAEFERVADAAARERYNGLVTGPDVERAAQRRDAVFSGDPAALKVDADSWYVVQSGTIRKVDLVGLALADQLDRRASEVASSATRRAWLTAGGTISLGIVALAAALLLAVRTSRRLRQLRAAALTVARRELPDAIAKVMAGAAEGTGGRPDGSSDAVSDAAEITRRIAASEDEVGEVADAFSSVHHTALRLASDQAELRLDVARMAETFARRIRTLITRQLRLLDDFERDETDPDALSRLFALDHIATRLRRNGENLLVLAGGEPGRPSRTAYPLAAVVTAAASEIDDFERVDCQPMDMAVAGPVVGDLVHLLAELLENATSFSPPEAPVWVDARYTVDGVLLRVHDSGIGLTDAKLAEVNARLAEPTARLSSAAAGTMGLYVVARLAARHGITVQLHATASGTVAYVLLPVSALAPNTVDTPRLGPVRREPVKHDQAVREPAGGLRVPATVSAATVLGAQAATLARPPVAAPLPQRHPGAQLIGEFPTAVIPMARDPVDPEAVRARLSALTEGVSAALRERNEPSPAAKDQ
jgi:hypothetical protein